MSSNGYRLLSDFVSCGSLKLQNGFPCGKWNDKGVGILHIRPFNISNEGQIDLNSTKFVETDKKLDNYLLKEGDVVFNNTNSEELVGKTAYWSRPERSVLSNHMTILRVLNRDELEPQFLAFFLLEKWFERHFEAICRRHVNQASVSTDRLGALKLPSFDATEQKKIARILSTVQRAIEAQERIIQTTTELKKALMHKLFTEGLPRRSPGGGGPPVYERQKQTEIGPIPESWEVVELSAVCSFQSGGTPSKKTPTFWVGPIPWVSPKDMKRPRLNDAADHISEEGLESGSKLAPAGSVFVVVRGMILAKTVPVALAEVPMAINQDMKAIVPGPKLRSDFLLYALETLRGNLFKKVGRSGHGTATLMSNEISEFKIPLPDLDTQREAATAIQNLETKKELYEKKHECLQDLFRTLLHELMTGKIRVIEKSAIRTGDERL